MLIKAAFFGAVLLVNAVLGFTARFMRHDEEERTTDADDAADSRLRRLQASVIIVIAILVIGALVVYVKTPPATGVYVPTQTASEVVHDY
jgi:hypothetical protein